MPKRKYPPSWGFILGRYRTYNRKAKAKGYKPMEFKDFYLFAQATDEALLQSHKQKG